VVRKAARLLGWSVNEGENEFDMEAPPSPQSTERDEWNVMWTDTRLAGARDAAQAVPAHHVQRMVGCRC
jgi:hypothetical protein